MSAKLRSVRAKRSSAAATGRTSKGGAGGSGGRHVGERRVKTPAEPFLVEGCGGAGGLGSSRRGTAGLGAGWACRAAAEVRARLLASS